MTVLYVPYSLDRMLGFRVLVDLGGDGPCGAVEAALEEPRLLVWRDQRGERCDQLLRVCVRVIERLNNKSRGGQGGASSAQI